MRTLLRPLKTELLALANRAREKRRRRERHPPVSVAEGVARHADEEEFSDRPPPLGRRHGETSQQERLPLGDGRDGADDFAALLYKTREDRTKDLSSNMGTAAAPESDATEKLARLKQLHNDGILTDEEYAEKRKKLVDEI